MIRRWVLETIESQVRSQGDTRGTPPPNPNAPPAFSIWNYIFQFWFCFLLLFFMAPDKGSTQIQWTQTAKIQNAISISVTQWRQQWLLPAMGLTVIISATVTLTDSLINWKFFNIVCRLFANLTSCQCRSRHVCMCVNCNIKIAKTDNSSAWVDGTVVGGSNLVLHVDKPPAHYNFWSSREVGVPPPRCCQKGLKDLQQTTFNNTQQNKRHAGRPQNTGKAFSWGRLRRSPRLPCWWKGG